MTTAQPGQEQRMECVECGGKSMANSQFCSQVCFERSTIKQTRPTADLGDDGELVERARQSADGFRKFPQEQSTADLLDALADRLILYMEAARV